MLKLRLWSFILSILFVNVSLAGNPDVQTVLTDGLGVPNTVSNVLTHVASVFNQVRNVYKVIFCEGYTVTRIDVLVIGLLK